ncbi:thermonuclease family protein [Parasphingopyxis marina]|uniref:Thermonuclease family protein n=1 Tax=Parasphingopyxis marina TaxID=2761622 RepID=A0A842HVI8_9SPHN|nr:thermonuclease family protein [Parasphingopyxis marina]MBC2776447.1 thermonuclease family protein [Parasphingopyxis marina]
METTVHNSPQPPRFGRKPLSYPQGLLRTNPQGNGVVSTDRCASGRSGTGHRASNSGAASEKKSGSLVGGMALFGIALAAFGIAFSAFGLQGPVTTASANVAARITSFSDCGYDASENCVINGSSFVVHGDRIQLAGIVAPDRFSNCAEEREKGAEAQARLIQLLNAGPVELVGTGTTGGRLVREAYIGRTSIGDTLVDEGLALSAGRRWCA